MSDEAPQMPPYDDSTALGLIGSRVLIGITMLDPKGALVRQWQFYGEVSTASRSAGIAVVLEGAREGETYVLPPCTSAFKSAGPGIYTLRTTGENVENPDYLVEMTIQEIEPEAGGGFRYRFDE